MIDLHCHILPGVDDGPADLSTALEMAKMAAADGIRTIVATPHIKDTGPDVATLHKLTTDFNHVLHCMNIPVEVLPGGDVSVLLHPTFMRNYTINNSRYILVEFPHHYLPNNSKEILFALAIQGLCPIITHPERNSSIIENPDKLLDMLHGNVLVQITAGSLCGEFGRDAQACAIHLLRKDVVHFLGTDAHDVEYRRPVFSEGLQVAQKIIDKDKALKLVQDNPWAVLADQPFLGS